MSDVYNPVKDMVRDLQRELNQERAKVRIHEIFTSISGEVAGFPQGTLATFVRFQGCPLNCVWCDTPRSRPDDGGELWRADEVVQTINRVGCPNVVITGGEPLKQFDQFILLAALLEPWEFRVTVETSGRYRISSRIVDLVHCWVVDYKTPGSGHHSLMWPANYQHLRKQDWIKFPIADRGDYEFAKREVARIRGDLRLESGIAFSPVSRIVEASVTPDDLARWMKADRLFEVSINVQIHRLVGMR